MMRRTMYSALLVAVCSPLLAGCMPKMTIADMKAMMPSRPVELDRLNAFAGKWAFEGYADFAFLDDRLKASGTNEARWEGNNWYLVSDGIFNMADLGEMHGKETWTYDTHAKVYRSSWVDSMGTTGAGKATYDEGSNTWHMKATSHGPHGKSTMKGTVTFLNKDTMEWSMSEHVMFGLIKIVEMSGTSRRL